MRIGWATALSPFPFPFPFLLIFLFGNTGTIALCG